MSCVVAIDGPAASGKGTIARAVAMHFGMTHLDTGLLYRAVAKKTIELGNNTPIDETVEIIDEGKSHCC